MWSGLPSWTGFLHDFAIHLEADGQSADLVRREIGHGDLLQAASYAVSKLTPGSFGAFIRKAVQFGTATPHAIHKAIVELGPTSFITTNYDTLIEQALGAWRADTFFPAPVTNKHLVELAEILSARSSHFIFKPHGDVNDVSSIILTREQYRLLLPSGERHHALEALKTLLITRPVLYLGFGLRDPDFIYLRDLLLNIYQGAVRDHWAIMPDVTPEEVDYWRGQYGIKLHGYMTHVRPDRSRDHRELLLILEALAASGRTIAPAAGPGMRPTTASKAERVLALTRYTAGLVRRFDNTSVPAEVRVSRVRKANDFIFRPERFEGWTTTRFLTEGPPAAYLIGSPGAGKSYALRLAACRLASRLQRACIDDALTAAGLTLPVFIDLKLYKGDLRAQIGGQLPAGFTLEQLRGELRLKLFLDAFNEMPSEHLENGALFAALDALESEIGSFDFAIASRTTDGLANRSDDGALYQIDWFEKPHVDAVLAMRGIKLAGPFTDEIRALLSRPFFLQLVLKGSVEVPANASPRDVYASFIAKLQSQFSNRFDTCFELLPIFSKVAYRAIGSDSEAFPLAWLTDLLVAQIPQAAKFTAKEVINWLVAQQILIPYTGRRASFVHQSITEYCAATELARRSRADMVWLRETITSKKWDQCLFLALALMEPTIANQVLSDAIEADLHLAINAIRYAEEGQSPAVSRILEAVIARVAKSDVQHVDFLSLHNLLVGPEHAELLHKLVEVRDSIGGEAVMLLTQIKGAAFKPELLDLLETHAGDYNFSANGIAPALAPMLDESDLPRLVRMAKIWRSKGDEDSCYAISQLLGSYEPERLLRAVSTRIEDMPPEIASLLAEALSERKDDASFSMEAELLCAYPNETTSSFCLALGVVKRGQEASYRRLGARHVEAIWSARFSQGLWASAMSDVCLLRPDLADHVARMAEAHDGIEAIALRHCAGADNEILMVALEQLLQRDDESLQDQPFVILPLRKLDWRGRELLFARSLVRDLPTLRTALLHQVVEASPMRRGAIGLGTLRHVIGMVRASLGPDEWGERDGLGEIVAHLGDAEVQGYCLSALVDGPEWLRHWVKTHYLHQAEGLRSDALSDEMIAALLADLNVPGKIRQFFIIRSVVSQRIDWLSSGCCRSPKVPRRSSVKILHWC